MKGTLPEYMERIAELATDEFFRRYDAAVEVVGDRPPWTRELPAKERLELWKRLQAAGEAGWQELASGCLAEGMSPQRALKTLVELNLFGAQKADRRPE